MSACRGEVVEQSIKPTIILSLHSMTSQCTLQRLRLQSLLCWVVVGQLAHSKQLRYQWTRRQHRLPWLCGGRVTQRPWRCCGRCRLQWVTCTVIEAESIALNKHSSPPPPRRPRLLFFSLFDLRPLPCCCYLRIHVGLAGVQAATDRPVVCTHAGNIVAANCLLTCRADTSPEEEGEMLLQDAKQSVYEIRQKAGAAGIRIPADTAERAAAEAAVPSAAEVQQPQDTTAAAAEDEKPQAASVTGDGGGRETGGSRGRALGSWSGRER